MLPLLLMLVEPEEEHVLLYIYNHFSKDMMAAAMSVVHDRHQAEDIVQDAFIRIIDKIHLIKDVSCNGLRVYTVLIVKSIAINRMIHRSGRFIQLTDEVETELSGTDWPVEDEITQREQIAAIRRCLSRMGSRYAYPMILRYYYGFSDSETAELLDIPSSSTVRSLCRRGRMMILREMGERGE